ncbi:MAG: tyrosine-type recombinase/integrase [Pseudomonadota bacterium]
MKCLSRAVDEYLALRRSLGFKLRHETWWLPDFISYLKRHGTSVITTELALEWAQQPAHTSQNWRALRLGAVRRFAKHHHASDPRTEIPPADLIHYQTTRVTPCIYTDEEVAELIRHAASLPFPLQSATYSTLLGLLAATGMRLGEAIALEERDVDLRRAIVTVHHGKFGKSRELPVHNTTLRALRSYATTRDRLLPKRPCPKFMVSTVGTELFQQNIGKVFARLRQDSGLLRPDRRPPHIHDLRHTFAVKTLIDWYRAGVNVERRLPWLSTYLGHVSPSSTYWYLTATPELLALAGKRAERAWGVRS